jgi:hypothetical protein
MTLQKINHHQQDSSVSVSDPNSKSFKFGSQIQLNDWPGYSGIQKEQIDQK